MSRTRSEADWARILRRAVLGLGAASTAGTALELATTRHWTTAEQIVPWVALAVLGVGLGLVLVRTTRAAIWVARTIGAIVAAAAGYGVIAHLRANYASGPLDFRYETRWASMGRLDRWWAVLSDKVGESPILAPGALVVAAACLCLATLGHPALSGRVAP